jgi:hypothetical protein
MEIATLIAAWFAVIVGLPPALRELGLNVRMFGKRELVPLEHPDFRYNQKRASWLPIAMSGAGLILAAFATYYFAKPRVEIVEKPVEKIIEKQVSTPCPASQKRQHSSSVQIPVGTTINATTNAPDSAAVGINTGTVNVNPPTNPNVPVKTYWCGGEWRSAGPGKNAALEMNACLGDQCPEVKVFKELVELNNAAFKEVQATGQTAKTRTLLEKCTGQIASTPNWLAPYLFCTVANGTLGNWEKAKQQLAYYDEHTGPSYDVDGCKELSDHLHTITQLK